MAISAIMRFQNKRFPIFDIPAITRFVECCHILSLDSICTGSIVWIVGLPQKFLLLQNINTDILLPGVQVVCVVREPLSCELQLNN
jgi:hypothetical protein